MQCFFQKVIISQILENKAEKAKSSENNKNGKLTWTQYHSLDGNI